VLSNSILIVDDDLSLCRFLDKGLSQAGYHIQSVHNAKDAISVLRRTMPNLMLLDNRLPDGQGLDLLKEVRKRNPEVAVIVMTGFNTTHTAIEAMRLGAFDYILKPFELEQISKAVGSALAAQRIMNRAVVLPTLTGEEEGSNPIIGKSKVMQEIYKRIGQVAESDITVLIRGESGTGKELVARAICEHSRRKNGPLLTINCAAIPEPLLESEVFGYERGAFTGAVSRRAGKFEQCNRGTILLDEIGDMTLSTQAKILRVLQEGEFERIGGNETVRVDVRILTSTNRNLEELIKGGRFREDLYYRLKIMSITLPPLRERREDIRELAEYFFRLYNRQLGLKVSHIDPAVFQKLASHDWPGNVRELEHTVTRALILCKGEILGADDIVFDLETEPAAPRNEKDLENTLARILSPILTEVLHFWGRGLHSNLLDKVEKILVQRALAETKGNQVQAARLLEISRNTLRHRIEKYHLSV
jgi:two-component system, NtrC family, response regulator AtoC